VRRGAVKARQGVPAQARAASEAELYGLESRGPVAAYSKALADAAAKTGESVAVTKDVMMIRAKYDDEDFRQELVLVQNEPAQDVLVTASRTVRLLEPFESTVMKKFITFLAKKRRLVALLPVCKEYVAALYFSQSIAPVLVKSASPLTKEQSESIKEKMKSKTESGDVKLINEIDGSLLAGFTLEWGYTDPEKLEGPTNGIDLSLKTYLEKKAIDKGVIAVI